MESSFKVNEATPLPTGARSLPKDSALIKVSYASINPVDYKLPEFGLTRYASMGGGPYIPSSDYAGTVIDTNLSHVKAGDKVAGCTPIPKFGALAEYAVIEGAENVTKLPEGVDLKDAATLPIAGQTAMQCIAPFVKEGFKVVINGASGGTGIFGVQIAKNLGCTVTAICSGANAEFCKSIGAENVIDYRSTDVVQELQRGGLQYDLIVDNVAIGGPIVSFFLSIHDHIGTSSLTCTVCQLASIPQRVWTICYNRSWTRSIQCRRYGQDDGSTQLAGRGSKEG